MAGKHDKVLDKDRYSILVPDLGHCFICGSGDGIQIHEVIHGTSARKKSKEDGLCIGLCMNCHSLVHSNAKVDDHLKQQAEKIWIEHYSDKENGVKDFIKRYGRNYLE